MGIEKISVVGCGETGWGEGGGKGRGDRGMRMVTLNMLPTCPEPGFLHSRTRRALKLQETLAIVTSTALTHAHT